MTESALAQSALGTIEKLAGHHDATAFDCGRQELNQFLQRFALPSQQANSSQTYVVCRNWRIVGYYSLAVGAVAWDVAPARTAKGLARHPIPIMILARLAVDHTEQGKGLGRALLKDALVRTAQAADIAGIRALVVHAKDDDARRWYEQFDFDPSPSDPLHLFLVVKDVKRLIAAASIAARPPAVKAPKVMKVGMCLCIENNSKWVRGKKRARENIERWLLSSYDMEKPKGGRGDRWDYILTIPYHTDEELDSIIYDDIIAQAAGIAEDRHCFIEPFVCSLDDPDRSW